VFSLLVVEDILNVWRDLEFFEVFEVVSIQEGFSL
jgi:hypothetical protein